MERYKRIEKLLGESSIRRLNQSAVLIFGLGGVGGYILETLARSGVGKLALVDFDKVSFSDMNRQLIATEETLGMNKTDAAKLRVERINPNIEVTTYNQFFDENSTIDFSKYDYIVDAIDSIKSKLEIAKRAKENGVKEICCLSAGNKIDGTRFRIGDISLTKVCPLARIMRKKLKEIGVEKLKVVWSDEPPYKKVERGESIPSAAFATGVAGLIAAGEVVKELSCENKE